MTVVEIYFCGDYIVVLAPKYSSGEVNIVTLTKIQRKDEECFNGEGTTSTQVI